MRFGQVGDLARRVEVWGYSYEHLPQIAEEIKCWVPGFVLKDSTISEAVYCMCEGGREHRWERGSYMVYDIMRRTLSHLPEAEVFLTFKSVGIVDWD